MMRKCLYILIFFLIEGIVLGQNNSLPNQLDTMIPPNPNSFSFATYGNNKSNLFTGGMSAEIPLLEYRVKNYIVPLKLGYQSSGVKIDQLDNYTGQIWNLIFGGVITRNIRGEDDLVMTNDLPTNLSGGFDSTLQNYLYNKLLLPGGINNINTEYDEYNFNFLGYSGKFIIKNNNIIQINGSDIKINIKYINNILYFEVTDANGIIYIFDKNEKTRYYASSCENKNSQNGYSGPMSEVLTTAWHLTKIIYPKGNELYIDYDDFNFTYVPGVQERVKKVKEQKPSECTEISNSFFLSMLTEYKEVCSSLQTNYAVVPKKIYSNNTNDGYIEFNYTTQNNYRYLNNISYYNNLNIKKDNINLEYLSASNGRRFLTRVNNTSKNETHDLEYINPENLPSRLSYSQDYWGYYNAANNNTFVPKNDEFLTGGNREVNTSVSQYGLLKKIIYPTKGFTELTYEQNTYHGPVKHVQNYMTISDYATYNGANSVLNSSIYTYSKTFNSGNIDKDELITIDAEAINNGLTCSPSQNINTDVSVTINIINTDTNLPVMPDFILKSESDPLKNASFYLKANTNYLIKIQTYKCIDVNYTFVTKSSYSNNEEIYTGGVRVKKIRVNDNINDKLTRYYYNKYDSKTISSGEIIAETPNYMTVNEQRNYCPNSPNTSFPNCNFASQTFKILSSSSKDNIFDSSQNSNISYKYVTESIGGDNADNGYIEHEFIINRDNYINLLHGDNIDGYKFSNTGWDNGNEINTEYYRNDKVLLKRNIFNFVKELKNSNKIDNIYTTTNYNQKCMFLEDGYLSNISVGYYFIETYRNVLSSQTTTDYHNGVPLLTTTNYYYDNPNHYQLTREESSLPDGTMNKKIINYAQEKGNQQLIDANMVGIPLETISLKNGKTVSKVETLYPTSLPTTQTGNLLLPLSVQSTRTNTISLSTPPTGETKDTELTYDQYDSKGNILQYTEKGLKPTVIIWGYNQTQPIAKIEGISYNSLMALSGVSTLVNNAITASDADVDAVTEQSLLAKLDLLRTNSSLSNYNITTYTYDPLIGVTSITPPNGIREIYKYDSANRLQSVVDINGKILKEYQYNYKQ